MQCAIGHCGHCQFGPAFVCKDGPGFTAGRVEPLLRDTGAVMADANAPSSRCGNSPRATAASSACSTARMSSWRWPATVDIALLPGGHQRDDPGPLRPLPGRGLDHHRTRRRADLQVRASSSALVTIGACATAGGIQALRNFKNVRSSSRRVRLRNISPRSRLRPRSPTMCRWISSCAAARSTSISCWR